MTNAFRVVIRLVTCAALLASVALLATAEAPVAEPLFQGGSFSLQPAVAYERANLVVAGPDGFRVERTFEPGLPIGFDGFDEEGRPVADGKYKYELRLVQPLQEGQGEVDLQTGSARRVLVESGRFRVVGGQMETVDEGRNVDSERGAGEGYQTLSSDLEPDGPGDVFAPTTINPNGNYFTGDGGFSLDLCIGCSDNFNPLEDLHIIENDTPTIRFDQTGFGGALWEVQARESYFRLYDETNNTVPLTIEDSIPNNTLFLDAPGNVGIGTSVPAAKLHVFGSSIRNEDSVTFDDWTWTVDGTNSTFTNNLGGTGLQLSNDMTGIGVAVDSAGEVGIGTTTPANPLDVVGDASFSGEVGIGTTTPTNPLDVVGDGSFSGEVGIGTTAPSNDLNVVGDASFSSSPDDTNIVNIGSGVNGDGGTNGIGFWESTSLGMKLGYDGTLTGVNNKLQIYDFGDSPLFTVTQGGNVGIGTSDPNARLHVRNGALRVERTDGVAPNIRFRTDFGAVTQDYLFAITPGAGTFSIRDATAGANVVQMFAGGVASTLVLRNGKVGVGTTNPQGTLDVNGSIYQSGSVLHADYVFEPGYELESIEDHATYMWDRKHLPAIPAAQKNAEGLEVVEIGSHRRGIVEELEKAHIYIAQLNEGIAELQEQNASLLQELQRISARLDGE